MTKSTAFGKNADTFGALALTDGKAVHAVDYAKLKRHVLGTYDIYSSEFGGH